MSYLRLSLRILLTGLLALPASAFASWSVTNLSLLYGDGFKLDDKSQYTITLDHARSWDYGDFFFFIESFNPATGDSSEYGEIHPRFSLSKISGRDFSNNYISDVYVATEVELGENHRAYLYGLGFDFKLKGFNYFNVNLYARDNIRQGGKTWQITPYWQLPFSVGSSKWSFEGFADIAGTEDDSRHNVIFQPQLLLDVGELFGHPGQIKAGFEYSYWSNKFGVEGIDQDVMQLMMKWSF